MFMMTFYFSRVTDLTYAKSAPVYKRLDSASIIWAPPEIEAGSHAHLRPNL